MKNIYDWSKRLKALPPYLFAQIDKSKRDLRQKGISFIDVSIGDPDICAPEKVIEIMGQSALVKTNQKYALDQGKDNFRLAIKNWFADRFGVDLDHDNEILPLIGSKEGLVHLPLGFVDPGQYVLIPSPGYPGYRGACTFAGAKIHEMPLLDSNGFLPDLKKIPAAVRNKARIIYVNYPNNPTTAIAPKKFLQDLVSFCVKYGIILAYDNAYSEIYFDKKPMSILEIDGAKEIAIEFHSLSKTFCMTGFRVGWACGDSRLIKTLLKVKTNVDSGVFGAIQDASAYALEKEGQYVQDLRATIKQRRDVFVSGLKNKGYDKVFADSTFYVWVKLPKKMNSSIDVCKQLLEKRVVATPGVGFGKYGQGYIRFALTVDVDKLQDGLNLL